MCGICGIVFPAREHRVDRPLLEGMTNLMVHRGPDDAGLYLRENVGLGFRRLSIIDLAAGHQPLSNEDETVWIVFNGEIYNYLDLVPELQALGHKFKTRCDTEVIVHAYEQWGAACVKRLRGMFAFAIHDQKKNLIFAARDRMGIKPFYYFQSGAGFVFASEIKPILRSGLAERRVNTHAIESFVSVGYVPAPTTLFEGIYRLLPGHSLTFQNGKLDIEPYWDFNAVEKITGDEETLAEQVDAKLRETVQSHLMSDVPLGVFLSGGLDSSAMVAVMSECTQRQIKTFSVGYENAPEANELEYARRVATAFKTEHHEFVLQPYSFMESINTMIQFTEEPLVEAAGIALYHLARCAKPFATVLLSGEGSDEVFCGYPLYEKFLTMQRMRQGLLPLMPILNAAKHWMHQEKTLKYLDWMTSDMRSSYRGTSCDVTPEIRPQIFEPEFLRGKDDYYNRIFQEHFDRVAGASLMTQLLYVDSKTWLPADILLKSDKMTMAASIECRVPFLDHELVALASSLPDDMKLRSGTRKYVLKKIMQGRLPDDIINRKKRGFPVPISQWFRGELFKEIESILTSSRFRERGYFKQSYVNNLLARHRAGERDFSRRLLTFIILELWHRDFIDSPPAA